MDTLYIALVLFRNRKYVKCADRCTQILEENPRDQAARTLKILALTRRVKVDELDIEEAPEAVDSPWSEAVATAPRPGTSLLNPTRATTALRRPGTGCPAITAGARTARTSRTAGTARTPGTARASLATAHARAVRLGTAMPNNGETLVQVANLDMQKLAKDPAAAKPTFEYLYYHEGDYRHAMELAVQATQACRMSDWWWKVALGKCYSALNLWRESSQQMRSALQQSPRPDTCLRLARTCRALDQPQAALEVCRTGEKNFPGDIGLLTEQARLLEAIGDLPQSVKIYRSVVTKDAMNTEAIASIAVHHFYNDQPEMALRYYRRVLAMGAYSAEVFNNVALCCLRAQHWDLTIACFRRALLLASEPQVCASLWYNLSHLALTIGDVNLAVQCLRLCIGVDPSHAAALNNLAALEIRRGHLSVGKGLLNAALLADPSLPEGMSNTASVEAFFGPGSYVSDSSTGDCARSSLDCVGSDRMIQGLTLFRVALPKVSRFEDFCSNVQDTSGSFQI